MKMKYIYIVIVITLLSGCVLEDRDTIDFEKNLTEEEISNITNYVKDNSMELWTYSDEKVTIEESNDGLQITIKLNNTVNWVDCYESSEVFTEEMLLGNIEEIGRVSKIKYQCDTSYIILNDIRELDIEEFNYEMNAFDYEDNRITDNYEDSRAKFKEEYIESTSEYEYEEIFRYAEDYVGKFASFEGKIVQTMTEGGLNYYRINVSKDNYGYYDDTIMVGIFTMNQEIRLLEDDIVQIYGKWGELVTYETVLGLEVTIPSVYARYIDLLKKN